MAIDEDKVKGGANFRYGDNGYIYNIHSPTHPLTGEEEPAKVGKIEPMYDI